MRYDTQVLFGIGRKMAILLFLEEED